MPAPRSSQPRKSAANSPAGDPSSVGAFNAIGADPSRNPACGADPAADGMHIRRQPLTNDGAK
jgi:hypothetical protein